MTLTIALSGVGGRMGRTLIDTLLEADDLEPGDLIERADHPSIGEDAGTWFNRPALAGRVIQDQMWKTPDVLVDFSLPEGLRTRLGECVRLGVPLVSGTTGVSDELRKKMVKASAEIPVLLSPNMSLGVNLLFRLARLAATALGPSADLEITETHHRAKVDSPSGTALGLLAALKSGLHNAETLEVRHGREGAVGPRKDEEIGIHALRGGSVTGEHTVHFLCPGERIELTHRAENRTIFASGAVWAARKLARFGPGLYDMEDLLEEMLSEKI